MSPPGPSRGMTMAAACVLAVVWQNIAEAQPMRVYFGTYSTRGSRGIYLYQFDPATGALTDTGLTAAGASPSFLALHPSGRFLYAAEELGQFEGHPGGALAAYAVDPQTGGLTLLNQQRTNGAHPCHVVLDPAGKVALAANYSGGNVAVVPIGADGQLAEASQLVQHEGSGPNHQRQEKAHAHSVTLDPSGRRAYVCDLGLDRVMIYDLDAAAGKLTPHTPPFAATHAAAGPRHMAFHPNGKLAYVINELDSTITAFAYDAAAGTLSELEHVSTLPTDWHGQSTCADIHIHPSGKFLYGSNRGHDSIAVFAIDTDTGRLKPLQHAATGGRTPRNFSLDPSGHWLLAANQDTDNVVVFAVDPEQGTLRATGVEVKVPAPVCVRFAG